MGNDLYGIDKECTIGNTDVPDDEGGAIASGKELYVDLKATAIAEALKGVVGSGQNAHVIYGGSAQVWGYSDACYDRGVRVVCDLLDCRNGAMQLLGVRTADSIGHLHVESVPQLCQAFVQWCKGILPMEIPKARL